MVSAEVTRTKKSCFDYEEEDGTAKKMPRYNSTEMYQSSNISIEENKAKSQPSVFITREHKVETKFLSQYDNLSQAVSINTLRDFSKSCNITSSNVTENTLNEIDVGLNMPIQPNSNVTEEELDEIDPEIGILIQPKSASQVTPPYYSTLTGEHVEVYKYEADYEEKVEKQDVIWAHLIAARPKLDDVIIELNKSKVSFGKPRGRCDFSYDDEKVSDVHAYIFKCSDPTSSKPKVYIQNASSNGTFVNGIKIGNKPRLLKERDFIQFCKCEDDKKPFEDRWFIFSPELKTPEERAHMIHEGIELADRYSEKEKLGSGYFSKVSIGVHKFSEKLVALKKINILKLQTEYGGLDFIDREVNILSKTSHPFVVNLIEHFEDETNYNFVLEYHPTGDLFTYLNAKKVAEDRIIKMAWQLLSALKYLHANKIVHRDIKPENVLVTDETKDRVVLADFGLSRFEDGRQTFSSLVGSPTYAAPEVNNFQDEREYDKKCDIWSLGVMLYVGATMSTPFKDCKKRQIGRMDVQNIFLNDKWRRIRDPKLRHLIKKMIVYDSENRLEADQLLRLPIFTDNKILLEDLILQELTYQQRANALKINLDHIPFKIGEYGLVYKDTRCSTL